MKEFIVFVCTDSTEIFFSKLSSAILNYNLPYLFHDSYCAGVSNKHCLLTFFIFLHSWVFSKSFKMLTHYPTPELILLKCQVYLIHCLGQIKNYFKVLLACK